MYLIIQQPRKILKLEKINEFEIIDSIVQSKDINRLFKLKDNSAFSIALHQMLVTLHDENPHQLNKHQMNLFLSMHLENSGQSCGILSCLQEWFPQYLDLFVPALLNLKAIKCATAIEKAINLIPQDKSWFYKSSSEETEKLMSKYDSEFSNYPDGSMPKLYREYAENYSDRIIENMREK